MRSKTQSKPRASARPHSPPTASPTPALSPIQSLPPSRGRLGGGWEVASGRRRCSGLFGFVQGCSGAAGGVDKRRLAMGLTGGLELRFCRVLLGSGVGAGVDNGKFCQPLSTWRQPLSRFGQRWSGWGGCGERGMARRTRGRGKGTGVGDQGVQGWWWLGTSHPPPNCRNHRPAMRRKNPQQQLRPSPHPQPALPQPRPQLPPLPLRPRP